MKLESTQLKDLPEPFPVCTQIGSNDSPRIADTFKLSAYQCKLCQKIFSEVILLKKHMIEELEFDNEIIGFLNLELGFDLSDDTETQIVNKSTYEVRKNLICPFCSKICKSKKGLEQHKGKAHIHKRKRCTCKICGKRYENKYALRFHITQVHEKATRVKCDICGSIIYNKYMLTVHIEHAHTKGMI
ncbi:unnamed protein product [Blepharisma stoltei]|uniref:C2H2-type domain-containing protein n=1 Tax=Blepharisma stoltei TaxID=1481888 RepID=A0AAU9JKG6_9CILI|nr:unnamed protein product [Blepharisma stoltei]